MRRMRRQARRDQEVSLCKNIHQNIVGAQRERRSRDKQGRFKFRATCSGRLSDRSDSEWDWMKHETIRAEDTF